MSPAMADVAEWRRRFWLVALPALAVFAFAVTTQSLFGDGDTNWQVAAGRWILAHGAVPRVDPFSYTYAGRPWVAHEWGAEVLLGGAYDTAGWGGVMLITATAAALAFAFVAAELSRWLRPISTLNTLALAFALFEPLLLARPHVIAAPLMACWLVGMLRARRSGRTPEPWLLALMLVWANLHGGYAFGLGSAAAFALEAVMDAPGRRRSVAVRWGAFVGAATLASAMTPNGIEGLVFPIRVMLMSSLPAVSEWAAADFSHLTPLEIALAFGAFVFAYRGVRMSAVRIGLLLLLIHMALQHIRQEAVLAIAGPLLIAEPLGRALEPARAESAGAPRAPTWKAAAAPMVIVASLFLGLVIWRIANPVEREDRLTVPASALAHLPAALTAQPVFNNYSFGGWLIFKGVRPFIDGRADLYGDPFVQNYLAVDNAQDAGVVDSTFARWKIVWTILTPDSRLAQRLDHTPGWRRIYADKWAVVHVRVRSPRPA